MSKKAAPTATKAAAVTRPAKSRPPVEPPPDHTSNKKYCPSCLTFRRFTTKREAETDDMIDQCAVCRRVLHRMPKEAEGPADE